MKIQEAGSRMISLRNIIFVLLMATVAFSVLGIYSKLLNDYLKDEAMERLVETAQSNKFTVYSELNEKQITLFHLADFIEDEPDMTLQEMVRRLRYICEERYFTHIGVICPDKNMYITDDLGERTIRIDSIEEDYFNKSIEGGSISRIRTDGIGGGNSIVFSRSVYTDDGSVRGIMFALYDTEILQDLLSLELFDGEGYSAIIDENGERIVAGRQALKMKDDTNNVYTNMEYLSSKNKPVLDKVKEDLSAGRSGLVRVTAHEPRYLYYQPLGINNMSLLTIIPIRVINSGYNTLMRNTYILSLIFLILAIISIINIIVNEKKEKQRLENILYNDRTTGGYSYEKFCMEAEKWMKTSDSKKAFIAFDIDKFRLINEIFGYKTGNIVLSDIWKVLHKNISEGIITRMYADDFLMMVKFEGKEKLAVLMENIMKDIAEITTIKIEKFRIVPSMGIYIINKNSISIEHMQNCAMMAKRLVKDKYGNFYCFYSDEIKNTMIEKKYIMDGIVQAMAKNEFFVYYQPKYDAKTQKITGGEALIRWIKQGKMFMSPVKFIPIAEEVGSIIDIDKYVFESVCRQQSRWKQNGFKILPVSVNVSRNRLYKPDFIEEYTEILCKYGLNTHDIKIEITEGNLVSEHKVSEQIVNRVRQAGFDVMIDDFGMGYSSMSMIRDINASEMKIDKSFVDDMSAKGRALLKNVISVAKIVNMKTVAEGVETKEQYEFLRDNDCDTIQGYYFAKPMPPDKYETYLDKIEK